MKKVSLFIVTALLAVSAGFVSCTKDEEDSPFDAPTIEAILNGDNLVDNSTKEDVTGTSLTFNLRFKYSTDKLIKIKISSSIEGKDFTVLDSTLNEGIFKNGEKEVKYTYKTNIGKSLEIITFSTTDKENRTTSFKTTIKPKEQTAIGGFITSEATLMGGQANDLYGSFYSISLGKVLTIGAATSQSSVVDFAYYYGAKNEATIGAPANSDVKTISYGKTKTASWTTMNNTIFADAGVKTDAMTTAIWDDAVAKLTSNTNNQITKLVKDQLVAYKTQSGIVGMFQVTAISETSTKGYITIKLIDKKK